MDDERGGLVCLKYVFPVMGYCNDIKVEDEERLYFENALKSGGLILVDRLKELFPDMAKHLKSWSPEDVRDYWLGEHNKIVKDNPLCRVYLGEVEKILPSQGNEVSRVKLRGLEGVTAGSYIPLQPKDFVSMHAQTIAEELPLSIVNQYLRQYENSGLRQLTA